MEYTKVLERNTDGQNTILDFFTDTNVQTSYQKVQMQTKREFPC
jgi:hypothetical protein